MHQLAGHPRDAGPVRCHSVISDAASTSSGCSNGAGPCRDVHPRSEMLRRTLLRQQSRMRQKEDQTRQGMRCCAAVRIADGPRPYQRWMARLSARGSE